MMGSYLPAGVGSATTAPQKTVPKDSIGGDPATWSREERVEDYVNNVVICGTPEKVIDDLQRMEQELPLDYLMCAPLSHQSFELFTERVLPSFL